MPSPFTPARRGRVYIQEGDFLMRDNLDHVEELTETYEQVPQFMPRDEWPVNLDEGDALRPDGAYPFPPDWDFYRNEALPALNQVRQDVLEGYADLTPMRTFIEVPEAEQWLHAGGLPVYKVDRNREGLVWPEHLATVHGILYDAIPNDRPLSGTEMNSLIAIMTYGIGDAVTWLPGFWTLAGSTRDNDNPVDQEPLNPRGVPDHDGPAPQADEYDPFSQNIFKSQFNPDFGMEIKDSSTYMRNFTEQGHAHRFGNQMNWRWARDRVKGHRWIIVPIREDVHTGWNMTIFDRLHAQLYIFDPSETAREERTEAIVHAWAKWFNWSGIVAHFTYFVPEVYVPSDGRDRTGLLSIHWLLMTLRNQVGPYMQKNDSSIITRDILIQPFVDRGIDDDDVIRQLLLMPTSSIPLPNWAPRFMENVDRAEAEVKRVIHIILCNEIGQLNHPVMHANPYRRTNQVHNAYQRLRPSDVPGLQGDDPEDLTTYVNNPFHFHDDSVIEDGEGDLKYFTAYGGPQFAVPRHMNIRELDPNNVNAATRAHPVVFDNETRRWFHIHNAQPPLPPANVDLDVLAIETYVYNPNEPLARELLQTNFRPSSMVRVPGNNDAQVHNMELELQGKFFRAHQAAEHNAHVFIGGAGAAGIDAETNWWQAPTVRGTVRGLGLRRGRDGVWQYGVGVTQVEVDNPGVGTGPARAVQFKHYFPLPDHFYINRTGPPSERTESSDSSDHEDEDMAVDDEDNEEYEEGDEGDSDGSDGSSGSDESEPDPMARFMRVRPRGAQR